MQTLSRMHPDANRRRAAGVRFVSRAARPADGTLLRGSLRGAPVAAEGDLIFTTAATGWGEILTDPSYEGQIVVLTHPMAGNYRIDPAELESDRVHARAPDRDAPGHATGRRPGMSLEELLAEAGIPALEGIDTRALTLALRRGAARRAVIRRPRTPWRAAPTRAVPSTEAVDSPTWESVDHVAAVSTRSMHVVAADGSATRRGRCSSTTA